MSSLSYTHHQLLSSHLHRSGAHVGEDLFSGSGILIITECSTETLLHVGKAKKKKELLIIDIKTDILLHNFQVKSNESIAFIEQDPLEREIHAIKFFYSCEVLKLLVIRATFSLSDHLNKLANIMR